MSEQCAELSKEKSNSNLVKTRGCVKWLFALVTNQIFVCALLFHTKQKRKGNKKGKGQNNQSQISYQSLTL